MAAVPRHLFVPAALAGRGVRRPRAPDRPRADDHAGGERGPLGRARGPDARRARPRDRDGLGLPGGRPRAPRALGLHARAHRRAREGRAGPPQGARHRERLRQGLRRLLRLERARALRRDRRRRRRARGARAARRAADADGAPRRPGRGAGPAAAARRHASSRTGATRTEDAGEVAYVPLVGRFGFAARRRRPRDDGATATWTSPAAGTSRCAASSSPAACRASATGRSPRAWPAR